MKKALSIAFAAFALFAFTSCQKENLISENQEPAHRIVTAVFEDNGTKTTLGGENLDTPLWKEGDIIRVFGTRTDGNQYDDITLAAGDINNSGKSITFTTTLTGTLYAVYPASATSLKKCTDGSITFTIPEIQDGTFGSANICVAKGDDKDNLVFSNVTSVLEFSQPTSNGVLRVCATAENAIAGTLTATFGEDNKATVSASGLTGKTIWTTAAAEAADKYYVAVAPVETGDVIFRYYKELENAEAFMPSGTLSRNTIYELTIPTNGYVDSYVTITMLGKTYKWAKCNLGAVTETEYGNYYAWGDIIGQAAATSETDAFATAFSWENCPFNNGTSYYDSDYFNTDKQNEVCPGGVLAKDYDVAHKVLGGNWRMPTKEEFDALCSLTKEWKTNYNWSGVNGCLFTDDNSNSIFLPAAGYGSDTGLIYVGIFGYYWSSSLASPDRAYYLDFGGGGADTGNLYRYHGQSVRALYEEPNYR